MGNKYDKTIGYSPLEDLDEEKMRRTIKINKRIISNFYIPQNGDTILVAGAGQGQESVIIGNEWNLITLGVDLNIENVQNYSKNPNVFFLRQNLATLAFLSSAFSLIYCYHVLEHVQDHLKVLNELKRVLKPGGVLFIGFPNKARILSYIGTSQKVSNLDRIKWNINDYVYRLRGKFDNKYGAHAGFFEKEFISASREIFSDIHPVRNQYMLNKYPKYSKFLQLIIKTQMSEFFFPSNYYICIR